VADLEFVVVRRPVLGRLVRHEDDTTSPLVRFDAADLRAGRATYEHDETSLDAAAAATDAFSVVAFLSARGAKLSQPRSVHVAVAARNVQPPQLINNRMLEVNFGIRHNDITLSLFVNISLYTRFSMRLTQSAILL